MADHDSNSPTIHSELAVAPIASDPKIEVIRARLASFAKRGKQHKQAASLGYLLGKLDEVSLAVTDAHAAITEADEAVARARVEVARARGVHDQLIAAEGRDRVLLARLRSLHGRMQFSAASQELGHILSLLSPDVTTRRDDLGDLATDEERARVEPHPVPTRNEG